MKPIVANWERIMTLALSKDEEVVRRTLTELGLWEKYQHLVGFSAYQELSRKIREEGEALANEMNIGNFKLPYSFECIVDLPYSKDPRARRLRDLQEFYKKLARLKR